MAGILDILGQAASRRMDYGGALQSLWEGVTAPRDAYQGKLNPLSAEGISRINSLAGMMVGVPGAPSGSLGSSIQGPLFHGSPRPNLSYLAPSERGPLGTGVYTTPSESIARHYAGEAGKLYEVPSSELDIFRGHGHRSDQEWFGFKADKERLLNAADPSKQEALSGILDKAWSNDGYPLYQSVRQLYGGDAAAQDLFKSAGFHGVSGLVDGPEVVIFGPHTVPVKE